MSKKTAIRSSRQALTGQPMQLNKITGLMLASALLSFAAVSVNAQVLANATVITGGVDALSVRDINGALSAGGQAAGYVITGGANLTVGSATAPTLVHNFNTVGGAGSGGGAGLGGAFFVDAGATLTVLNTDFASNRAQGGTGGGGVALSYLDQLLNVTGATLNLTALPVTTAGIVESGGLPLMTRNVNGGAVSYTFDRLAVSNDVASLLKSGTTAAFDNYGTSVKVASVTSGTVALEQSVTAAAKSLSTYVPTVFGTTLNSSNVSIPVVTTAGRSGYVIENSSVTLSYAFTQTSFVNNNTGLTTYGKAAVAIADLSGVNVGDKLVTGTNSSQISNITDVVRYTDVEDTAAGAGGTLTGKVKSFTLDKAISGTPSYVDVIKSPSFKAVQFAASGNNVTIPGTSTLKQGMTVTWTENNASKSAIVQSVSGRTVTLSGQAVGATVTELKLVENPIVSDNAISVTNASSKFTPGQVVYVPGSDGSVFQGTVYSVVNDVVTVTPSTSGQKLSSYYDPSLGLALKTAAASVNGSSITLPFSAGTKTDAQVQALLAGRSVSGSSFSDGTKINTVTLNKTGNVVTSVTLGLSAAPTTSVVESFRLLSPMSYGGNMNNIVTPSGSSTGSSGYNANFADSFFNDSEGFSGTNGQAAGSSSSSRGNNGGAGGSGSMGLPVNYWLMYDLAGAIAGVAMASIDLVLQTADIAEAVSELATATLALTGIAVPDPQAGLGFTAPDPLEIAAATLEVTDKGQALANATLGMVKVNMDLAFSTSDLVIATANLILWNVNLGRGLAGLGGSGGDGGSASGGADFFGGGIGGAGGAGGAGATPITDGGNGGAGGSGGSGGFGAGGGAGGAGGAAGANGNSLTGDAGGGGNAGFGAGSGVDGEGNYGGGGSGLGGSIFVRNGGKLLIQGNAHFLNNYVAGGSTASAGGEAGGAAGSDLFIMKGSTVTFQPGAGKTIQFDGTIADDSLATDGGYSYAAGDGADIHIGGTGGANGGLVVFNGANTYSGHTILEGATLSAVVGVGINDLSLVRFNGSGSIAPNLSTNRVVSTMTLDSAGTFLLQEDYARRAGLNPGETAWTGSGGFASALAGGVKVTLGSVGDEAYDQQLVWGRDGFFVAYDTNGSGANGVMTFGSEYSKGAVEFTNNVLLNNQVARVGVYNNRNFGTSQATLSGNWINTGTGSTMIVGDSSANSPYNGTLFMTGASRLDQLVVAGGTLSTYNAAGEAGSLFKTTSDLVVMADAINGVASQTSRLQLFSDESLRNINVLSGGSLTLTQGLTAGGNLVNLGEINILGSNFAAKLENAGAGAGAILTQLGLDYLPAGYSDWNGQLNVAGTLTNLSVGRLNQTGDMQLGTLINQGTWTADGNIGVTGSLTNSGSGQLLVKGNVTTGATGDVRNDNLWSQVGNLAVGRDLLNTAAHGSMTLTGTTTVARDATNEGGMELTGDLTVTRNFLNSGTTTVTGVTTVVGNATNTTTGVMSLTGNLNVAGNLQNSNVLGVTGNTTVTGNLSNSAGSLTVVGDLVNVGGWLQNDALLGVSNDSTVTGYTTNTGTLSIGRDSTVTGYSANTGTLSIGRNSTVTGYSANTGTLSIGGNSIVSGDVTNSGTQTLEGTSLVSGNTTNSGTLSIRGNSNVVGFVTNSGRLSVGTQAQAGNMVVGGAFTNSGVDSRLTVVGNSTVVGDMTNDGVMSLTGSLDVEGNLRNNRLATITGNSNVTGNFTNDQSMAILGNLNVVGNYVNSSTGVLSITGNTVVTRNMSNAGNLLQTGNLTLPALSSNTGLLSNTGFWNFGSDATVKVGQLGGTGTFCLSSSTATDCSAGQAANVTMELTYNSLFDGLFAGSGGLTKTGSGELRLTQNQTFTGGLTVKDGNLVALGTMADTLDIVVGPNGTYTVGARDTVRSFVNNAPHSVILNADLTTTAGFENNGRLAMTGDIVVNGSTQTNERVLNLATSGLSGSALGNVEIAAGTVFRLVQSGNTTYLGAFTRADDNSSLVKEGVGKLTLAGLVDLRYVTINEGELALTAAGILKSDAIVTVNSSGTLSLVTGSQTIDQLLGLGKVNLGANNLTIEHGGEFEGQITGSGVVVVKSGIFNIAGKIDSGDSGFAVKSGSTTNVSSTGELVVKTLEVETGGTLTLGSSANPGGKITSSGNVNIAGDLRGSGVITGNTFVKSGGHLMPGYSPGAIAFTNGLTLEGNSVTTMEVANKLQAAGTGFDHLEIGSNKPLNVQTGAKLEVKEYGAFRNGELLMSEKLNLFGFTPGKITGTFGNVSMLDANGVAITDPRLVLNLATGNVVGLGNTALSVVATKPATSNELAIYQGLQQSTTGGVAQFYGGRFIENLTTAIKNNTSTRAVFNAYNPEAYQSLSDVTQEAAQAALPTWKSSYLAQEGFLAFAGKSYKATSSADDHQGFGVSFTSSTVGFVRSLGDKSLMVTAGNVDARTESSLLRGVGDGLHGSVALLGRLENMQDTTWHVGLGLSKMLMSGNRDSLNSVRMGFSRIGARSTVLETGLETKRGFGQESYLMGRGTFALGSTSRDAFTESGATLDNMSLKAATTSYKLLDASFEMGTKVASTTDWYGSLGVQLGDVTKPLTASFDNNQAQVTVNANSALNSTSKLMTGLRYRDSKGNTFEASIGGTRAWDRGTNALARVNIFVPF